MPNLLDLNKKETEYVQHILYNYDSDLSLLETMSWLKEFLTMIDNELKYAYRRRDVLKYYLKHSEFDVYFEIFDERSKMIWKTNLPDVIEKVENRGRSLDLTIYWFAPKFDEIGSSIYDLTLVKF